MGWLVGWGLAVGSPAAQPAGKPKVHEKFQEQAHKMLDGLRERGYFDTALDYLEWLRASRFCPEELQKTWFYEAAKTNLMAALATQDMKYRVEYLDQARKEFDQFLKDHPVHPLAPDARLHLGNILVERAKIKRDQANKPTTAAEEKNKLIKEAQTHLEEAYQVFLDLERYYTNKRAEYGKVVDPKWPEKKRQEFEEVVRSMAMARINLAQVDYELALTYDKKSEQFKKKMTEAAESFGTIQRQFKDWLAGLYAWYWQARCYKEMGDLKRAQGICQELAAQPDDPKPFRDIKNKALALELEILHETKNYQEIWKKVEEWLGTARPDEESSPEGLSIRFYGAQAGEELLNQQKEKKDPKIFNTVREYYRFVARYEGPHQMAARVRLRQLGQGPLLLGSYEEARDYGRAALDELQAAELELRLSAGQGSLDPKKKQELEQRMQSAREEAKMYFVQALRLATGLAPERRKEILDELNMLRYYLAYLNYLSDNLYEAAILGEFLARKYPTSGGARPGAKIALACWLKLRSDLPKDADRSFETARMTDLAEYIAGRWKDAPEAEEAIVMLLRSAVADQDPKKALEYLNRLPAGSGKRPEAEVLIGQALWSAYVRGARLPENERPPQQELDQMRQQAQQYLEQGIEGLRKQLSDRTPIDYTLASAGLSLAQLYIETGQANKALERLTDAQIGPLTLVQANHPVTERGTFRAETYKAALRAYVAQRQLEKAEQVMNTLEKVMAADPEGSGKLTQLYISLGMELERHLNRLRQERKDEEAKQVLEGFELFLDRIAQRPDNTFNSLYWVAETFQSLGAGLDPGGMRSCPPEVKPYYEKAVAAFVKLLQQVDEKLDQINQQLQPLEEKLKQIQDQTAKTQEEEKILPLREEKNKQETIRGGILLRLARAHRRLGQYKEALKWITLLLQDKPMMIDGQLEGAYICQAWGAEEPKYYLYAIQGGLKARKDGQEFQLPIWGWGRLARTVQRFMMDPRMESPERQADKQRLSNYFHEARYNLALCRFEYAKTLSGQRRTDALKQAEEDIMIVYRLMPELGGPEWFAKYNDLLKRIQQTQGKTPTGLSKPKSPASTPTASR
ncbi:MAG: hypothetical protein NZ602_17415 [Thermoguttaceae bacterium]|nr:hypothetical protein [Thermoguttaceae bacterium]MDW8038674.1 hypothetical protein [Thermoguttaceae bacterium]